MSKLALGRLAHVSRTQSLIHDCCQKQIRTLPVCRWSVSRLLRVFGCKRKRGGGGAGCEVQTVTVARTGRHIPVPRLDCSTTPLLARSGWGISCRGTQVGGLYIGSRLERVRRAWLEEIHRGWRLEELHRGWGLICSVNAALREAGLMFP